MAAVLAHEAMPSTPSEQCHHAPLQANRSSSARAAGGLIYGDCRGGPGAAAPGARSAPYAPTASISIGKVVVCSESGEELFRGASRDFPSLEDLRSTCIKVNPELSQRHFTLVSEDDELIIPGGSLDKVYRYYFGELKQAELVLIAMAVQAPGSNQVLSGKRFVYWEDLTEDAMHDRLQQAVPDSEKKLVELRATLVRVALLLARANGPCTVLVVSSSLLRRKDVAIPLPDCYPNQEGGKLCKALERLVTIGRLTKERFVDATVQAWATGGKTWSAETLCAYVKACGALDCDNEGELVNSLTGKPKGAIVLSSRGTLVAAGVRPAFPECDHELRSRHEQVPSAPELQAGARAVHFIQEQGATAVYFERTQDALHAVLPQRSPWVEGVRVRTDGAPAPLEHCVGQ